MAFPEFVDLRIAAEASRLQMNQAQRDVLQELSSQFEERTKYKNLNPIEGLQIFQEILLGIDGATEAFALEGALVVFNLETLKNNLKI